ncbi:hypothetical protein P7C70_g6170, partial [Phenoliferia sp. Uapishka_3]
MHNSLALVAILSVPAALAHMTIFTPSMYGLGPKGLPAGLDVDGINPNGGNPTVPVGPNLQTQAEWWFRCVSDLDVSSWWGIWVPAERSPSDATAIAPPQDPTFCAAGNSSCTTTSGSKRPIYAYNNPTNVAWYGNDERAGYRPVWSFEDGAQNDIFLDSSSSSSASTTSESSLKTSTEFIAVLPENKVVASSVSSSLAATSTTKTASHTTKAKAAKTTTTKAAKKTHSKTTKKTTTKAAKKATAKAAKKTSAKAAKKTSATKTAKKSAAKTTTKAKAAKETCAQSEKVEKKMKTVKKTGRHGKHAHRHGHHS